MFDALIPSQEPTAPLDLAPFAPAMPTAVLAELARAARGEGMVAAWWSGRPRATGPTRVLECDTLANRGGISHELFGWLAGITAFEDPTAHVLSLLRRPSHRDPAIEPALVAVAHGIAGGRATNARMWSAIEALAGRLVRPPTMLARALPAGVVSRLALVRGAALRIAQRLGERGRAALEAARATASAADGKLLDKALVALAGGAVTAAPADADLVLLGELLEAWRRTHDPRLEGPIARIGNTVARARGPLVAGSRAELEGAWLALAANLDPADVDRLFDTPWPTSWKAAALRVRALAAFAADPRIACRAPAIVRRYDSSHVLPLYRAVAELVVPSVTRAMLPEVDTLAAEVGRILAKTYAWHRGADPLQQVYDAIDAIGVTEVADPALLARCAGLDAAAEIEALYAEHAANPGDLGARAVLADALQISEDPRGELIALQLALADGVVDAKAARRAEALIAEHGDAWTGPLPGVRRASRRFERGFLVAAETTASPALLARSRARPEWRTVEELGLTTVEPGDVGALLHQLPLLRRLACRRVVLEALVASGARFPGVRVLFSDGPVVPSRVQFPDLEVLGVQIWRADAAADVEQDIAALGVRALVHFAVRPETLVRAVRGVAAGPPEVRFVVGDGPGTFAPPALGVLRIRRDDPTTVELSHVGVRRLPMLEELVEGLAALGVRRLAVHPCGLHGDFFDSRRLGLAVVPGDAIDIAG